MNNPSPVPEDKKTMKINTAALREMLVAAFDDSDLTMLCFDHFRPVYDKFAQGLDHNQKIQLLVDHCQRYGQVDRLLDLVKEKNPHQYNAYILRVKP